MANTSLNKTLGTPTNNYKWTISCWVKRATLGDQTIMSARVDGNNNGRLYFNSSNQLSIVDYQSTNKMELVTTSVYKDVGAWYNIVVSSDNSIGSPVTKIYVNGTETTNSTNTQYSQNQANLWNSAIAHYIGQNGASASYFDGSLSHFHFVDGTAYAVSTFGSTDSTTGEWSINTAPSITMGNNGFTILKDGNTITDQSSNSNDFSLTGGTLTKTEDCPANVFATNNPLDNYFYSSAFSNGNTTIVSSSSTGKYSYGTTTFGIPDGKKIYCEVKMVAVSSGSIQARVGLISYPTTSATISVGSTTYTYGYNTDSGNIVTGNAGSSYGAAFALGDIMRIAIDTVNNKLYFSKNETWQNSGNPESGATGTGAVSIADLGTTNSTNSGHYFLGFSDEGNNAGATLSWNFGNGYFGTTAVSSAGTSASTPGIFEYDVPTGYQPLSTKGLNA